MGLCRVAVAWGNTGVGASPVAWPRFENSSSKPFFSRGDVDAGLLEHPFWGGDDDDLRSPFADDGGLGESGAAEELSKAFVPADDAAHVAGDGDALPTRN